jgi:ankyrin repeat protein
VNSKDEGLVSPLSYAAENGHSEIVLQFLALADIDLNSRDERLRFPLWYAAKNKHLEQTSEGANRHVKSSYNTRQV